MKQFFLILFLLIQATTSYSQKGDDSKNLPFQVILADNVTDSRGRKVENLDLISINDQLTIGKGGILAMMHYSGFPIEIERDTIIKMIDLQKEFVLLKHDKKRDKYFMRPNIEYLFINDSKQGRKAKLGMTGACHDCNTLVEITYPPIISGGSVLTQANLCLEWESYESNSYQVDLKNLFDKNLKTYKLSGNTLFISESEIKELFDGNEGLLISISNLTDEQNSMLLGIKRFPSELIDFPFKCKPDKATYALITGFYMETSLLGNLAKSEEYFRLATELSDKDFFKEMLENFLKRHEL